MTTTMKQAQIFGAKDLRIVHNAPVPQLESDYDVLIHVAFCGICGTDLHEYTDGPIFGPNPGEIHEHSGVELPLAMGHEFSGTVEKVGSKVKNVQPGDRVCVDVSYACREQKQEPECYACRIGSPNACARLCLRGLSAPNGGISQYSVVEEHSVHKLPDSVPLDIGAMVQPMSISWHAVRISGFKKGDSALVIGAGPIGLAAIMALEGHGASRIIVSEPAEIRRTQALALGVNSTIDPTAFKTTQECAEKVLQLSGPSQDGVNYVFDCGGFQSTVDLGFASLKMGGTLVNLAVWPHEKTVDVKPMGLTNREKKYMGSMGLTAQDMEEVLNAFATGKMSMEKAKSLITAKVPIEETLTGGIEQLLYNKANHTKILIAPNGIKGAESQESSQQHCKI